MLKKIVLGFTALAILSLNLYSCGNEGGGNYLPPNIITEKKDFGITAIFPNAYKSLGVLAKQTDSEGKNHTIELDNALKYKLDSREFSYYSFSLTAKYSNINDVDFLYNNQQMTKISPPDFAGNVFMEAQALKNTGDKTVPAIYSTDLVNQLQDKKVVFWEDKKLSNSESKFSFLIMADLIPPPKSQLSNSNKFKLELRSKAKATLSDWVELTRSPIHLAVIGDSVMWNQGVHEDNKLHTMIKKVIEQEKGQIVRLTNYANSGSKFGDMDDNTHEEWNGELARPTPTINAQLKRVNLNYKPMENTEQLTEIVSPNRVDLLLMDGGINNITSVKVLIGIAPKDFGLQPNEIKTVQGINDVNDLSLKEIINKVKKVLNVIDPNNKAIRADINDAYCFNETKNDFSLCQGPNNLEAFLEEARKKLPNAQIIDYGYFPLLTNEAKLKCDQPIVVENVLTGKKISINLGVHGLFGLLAFWLLEPQLGENTATLLSGAVALGSTPVSESIRKAAVSRSAFWTNHSNRVISRAVELVNNKKELSGRGLLRFVPIAHKFQNNPIFSSDSYLWGFADNKCQKDDVLFPVDDEVKVQREELCRTIPGFNQFHCPRVSLFHPNSKGFEKGYFPETLNYLRNSGLLARTDI